MRYLREWSVAVACLLVLSLLALRAPAFFHQNQLLSVLCATAPVLIVACGMSLVIISRQIDISVGSQFSVAGVVLGLLIQTGWPISLSFLVTLVVGALLAALNGVLVALLGLPSIVVTLATMVTWREGLRWWRQGEFVRDLPPTFQWFGLNQVQGEILIILCAGAVFAVLLVSLKYLAAGRYVYAVGSDAEAARLAGISPRLVTFSVFVLLGLLSALAACLNAVRFVDVDPNSGTGLELQTIAAVVVGGVAISGGRGTLWGVLAGFFLLASISPGLVFLNLPPQWEKVLQGCIILLAVASDGWRRRTLNRRFDRGGAATPVEMP